MSDIVIALSKRNWNDKNWKRIRVWNPDEVLRIKTLIGGLA